MNDSGGFGGFGGDDRRRFLVPAAILVGAVIIIILLFLIVGRLLSARGGTATVTPTLTSTRAGTLIVSSPVASPSIGTSSRPATPLPSASATATKAAGKRYVVANTGGDGVRLRATPSATGDPVTTLADNAALEEIGPPQDADGRTWRHVRVVETKEEGWVAAEFTKESP